MSPGPIVVGFEERLAMVGGWLGVPVVPPPLLEAELLLEEEPLDDAEALLLALDADDDATSPPEVAHAWRRGLPKCFTMFVYGAGADAANERPDAIGSTLEDFYTRGEAFLVRATDDRLFRD